VKDRSQKPTRPDQRSGLRRIAGIWIGPLALAFYAKAFMVPLLARLGISGTVAQIALAIAATAALAIPFQLLYAMRHSSKYDDVRLALRPVRLAFVCTGTFVLAGVLAQISSRTTPFGGWIISWAVGSSCAWIYAYGAATDTRMHMFERLMRADDVEHARELGDLSAWLLDDDEHEGARPLTDDERVMILLNLAGAMITLSAHNDDRDWLGAALETLDEVLCSVEPSPVAFLAAQLLVEAQQVKEQRTGDDVGWDDALVALDWLSGEVAKEVEEAPSIVEAAYAVRYDRAAASATDETTRRSLRASALARLEAAVISLPEGADMRRLRATELMQRMVEDDAFGADLDAAIVACRAEVRRLRRYGSDDRWAAFLRLADLYSKRAALPGHSQATRDVLRAYLYCFATALMGNRSAEARRRIPQLSSRLIEAAGLGRFRFGTPSMYEKVYAEQMRLSPRNAADVSVDWAAWAERRRYPDQAAEASWRWVTAATADLRGRVTRDKEARIAAVQQQFFEAAVRLVAVERHADAVVALELGRAVLLTERLGRRHEGLAERLRLAGHPELAERWSAVNPEVEAADRARFGEIEEPALPDGSTALASSEYVVLAEHESLLSEIAELEGFEDVGAPLGYEQLRLAAADGPIVYLLAQEQDGLALVVTGNATAPAHVPLPAVGIAYADAHARRLRELDDLDADDAVRVLPAVMEQMLPDLRRDVLTPLAPLLPAGALVTLVPLGALGELPLHAAGAQRDEDRLWRDHTGGVVFRYAPNARVLLGAQRRAAVLNGRTDAEQLMSAAVPDAPDEDEIRHALGESSRLTALFGAENTRAPQPADAETVLNALQDCTIWHFACHGSFDVRAPLESTLRLHDRPVTLREILAQRRSEARVALLSACQTARLGDVQPDEVTTFPSAMLQAGAAGVVSCMAVVDDEQAMLLMLAYAVRHRAGLAPPRALADAQAWLRAATNAELNHALGEARPLPDPRQEDLVRWLAERPFAEPGTWAAFSYTGA
jgi:CHAT domain-containing protein